nr:class F sortase [Herbihabitans rhizosphaerae]
MTVHNTAPQARQGDRRSTAAALPLVLLLLFSLIACGSDDTSPHDAGTSQAAPGETTQPGSAHTTLPRSDPAWIDVPSIGAHSSLVPTGVNADRTIEVPPVTQPMQASWYKHSPTPGEIGPSIILGHVNGNGQNGVFWRLHEMKPGAEVHIGRQDHSVATFVVDRVEQIPKKHFPTDKVYGSTASPQVRLITCGGEYDKTARSYRDNWIVYGTLKH